MAKEYRQLCMQERALIETQLGFGMKPSAIAVGLSRSRSTVTREMHRNGWKPASAPLWRGKVRIAGGYRSIPAEARAHRLSRKARVKRKLIPGNSLWVLMEEHLRAGLSPAQIARTLARMPEPARLCYQTIYTSLYAMPRGELRSTLLSLTRRRHHVQRPRRGKVGPRKPPIPDMVLIDQRPVEIQMRLIPGHWEGDMIIGKGNRSQVGTLVERTTLFVALVKLDRPHADIAAEAFTKILNRFDSQMRRSMTYDQGSEMRHHKRLTEQTGVDVYFAHPRAPWERGISENTNGLLRQYLPKGIDLSVFSQEQLDDIAWKLNTRIRKSLGWKAPAELFLPEGAFDFVEYWSPKKNTVALDL
ncbi:MAG TPA: IS30 family transposase [Acidobacteriaceae bacterium]|jgi:IS30 family transposase